MFVDKAHSALICGSTGCGKTKFMLDLLETDRDFFEHIIIICPTLRLNKTYHRTWLFDDPRVLLFDDVELKRHGGLDRCLHTHYETIGKMDDSQVLFIIDDCAGMNDIKKKNHMITELAFSGRHANCSVWILTQKYNSVLTDFRQQIKWLGLFFCKDRDSFNEALRENDVIPTPEERNAMRNLLAKHKHSKLILITEQPTSYKFRY